MTSTARVSPSLAIPATQNTAPILEFRCLYTHDLRQKKKRWQDGFLRFHTFNKRVMVYDIERNFIGDSHWREDGAVQDGDELKLDKGVLIQVGEETGRTEQDLTELLEKRRPAKDVSPRTIVGPSSAHQSSARPSSAALAQLRPKSLNALLGTPRGAYGRAILPTKSPYDDRQNENPQEFDAERPLKRQKLNADRTSKNGTASDAVGVTKPVTQPVRRAPRPTPAASSMPKTPGSHQVIVVESDNESEMPSSPLKRLEQSVQPGPKPSLKPARAAMKPQKSIRKPARLSAPLVALAPLPPSTATSDRRKATSAGIDPSKEDDRPLNPLRIVSGKGRKKLMYRELLPNKAPSLPATLENPVRDSRKSQNSTVSKQVQPLDDLELFRRDQQNMLQKKLAKCRSRQKSVTPDHSGINAMDHDIPEDVNSISSRGITAQPLGTHDVADNNEEYEVEESLFISQEPPPEQNWLSKMDEILVVPPNPSPVIPNDKPPPLPPLNDRHHPNALTNSENREGTMKLLTAERQGAKILEQPAIPDHPLPQPQLPPAPISRRSPFRKALSTSNSTAPSTRAPPSRSISDLTHSRSVPAAKPASKPSSEAASPDRGLGPWSREAFDLFGWRPGEDKGKGQQPRVVQT
ncbi:hypothetical protein MMC11_007810 [Xylographa trunciseda]|nr:hypothetical protein [Xylographa trunciseda]